MDKIKTVTIVKNPDRDIHVKSTQFGFRILSEATFMTPLGVLTALFVKVSYLHHIKDDLGICLN